MLARVRKLIKQANPDVVETWKGEAFRWVHNEVICTSEAGTVQN